MTWEEVDALPSQTGQAGEYLKTDGTTATWEPAGGGYDVATTSTGYFDLPSGTDAQRPGSPATGMLRYNSDATSLEHYADGTWIQFAGSAPTVSSVSPTTVLTENTTVTITGVNFQAGATVKLIGLDSTQLNPNSVAFINSGELSITTPVLTVANEPYDIKVTNPNGGSSTLVNCIDAGGIPAWTSPAAGSLGTWYEDIAITPVTMVATDPDAQTVTYSVESGAIAGVTLDTSTGVMSGTPNVNDTYNSSGVTHNFTIGASDGINTTNRAFNIVRKWNDGTQASPFQSLAAMATFITNESQASGSYYFSTKSSTTTQFRAQNEGANGVWLSIPIGTTNDGTNTGAIMTSSDFYTKEVYGDQSSANNIGWNGSNQWDTTGSTNASGNNVAAYVAVIDFGLPYRYVAVYSANVSGSGAQTADWTNRQDSIMAAHDPGGYSDGPWMAFQRPSDFIMQANWGNVSNSNTTTNFSSFGTPLDLGSPGAGTEFCIGVCGGSGEHYIFNTGTIYLKA
jgi:hypothetical protein